MAQSPISQITVSKPSATTPSPTNGSQRPVTGPQNKTESTPFEFNDLRFPLNVGASEKTLHWIKFIPNVQNKSSYSVKKAQGTSGGEVLSRVDGNRLGGPQLGRSTDPLNGAVAAGVLGTGLGVLGAVSAAADALSDPTRAASFGTAAIGGGVGGVVVGAFAGAVVGSIDLTRKTRRAAGSISLYMPDTVNQTVVNDYDQVSLTQALGTAGLVMQAGESLIDDIKKSNITNIGQTLGSSVGGAEIKGALAEKTGAFGQGITDVLLFSAGYAQNPQVELLFKTIQNREFLFDFKFVPRNKKEAEEIIKIIQAFRFFAAPEIPTTGGGRYFVPPSEFDIVFMVGSGRNANLPQISTCVLQGIDVNYGSAGQWSAFRDGMPVEIAMQLRFKEVEIMHKELVRQGY
jgi:hypothetical protein